MDEVTERWAGESAQVPAVLAANRARVERGFWAKLRGALGRIPFAHDLLAAYYCAMDPQTPVRVRATLFGALAYFILPMDAVPDILAAIGFTDDAAVLMGALSMVAAHVKPRHRAAAEAALADTDAPPAA